MRRATLWALVTFGFVLGAIPLSGRELVPHWPYKELQKEADVIVVGSFEKTVEGDQELIRGEKFRESLTVQKTTLKVESVLKGELKEDTVDVVHVQFKEGHRVMSAKINSFEFVARKQWTDEKGAEHGGRIEYMLFLKRVAKKPYFLPVSGLLHSEPSVKVMYDAFHL